MNGNLRGNNASNFFLIFDARRNVIVNHLWQLSTLESADVLILMLQIIESSTLNIKVRKIKIYYSLQELA